MSKRTSESTIFNQDAALTAPAGTKRVWNRKLQMWVDIAVDEEKPIEAFDADSRPSTGVSSNAFAVGSNQNSGNVLTDRPTTRVRAPPGGASTFSISGGEVESAGQRAPPTPSRNDVATAAVAAAAAANVAVMLNGGRAVPVAVAVDAAAPMRFNGSNGVSSNAFATGSNQNSGNFITDRHTTKVSNPPGGRTSICLG